MGGYEGAPGPTGQDAGYCNICPDPTSGQITGGDSQPGGKLFYLLHPVIPLFSGTRYPDYGPAPAINNNNNRYPDYGPAPSTNRYPDYGGGQGGGINQPTGPEYRRQRGSSREVSASARGIGEKKKQFE